MYAGSKYESHYTVWTAWISIRVRVRVRVYFILQNLAPLALPYMCPQPFIRLMGIIVYNSFIIIPDTLKLCLLCTLCVSLYV